MAGVSQESGLGKADVAIHIYHLIECDREDQTQTKLGGYLRDLEKLRRGITGPHLSRASRAVHPWQFQLSLTFL